MRAEEKEEFDPDKLISQTIRFLEKKKEDYVQDVIDETDEAPNTNPKHADIDVYIGSNQYYYKVQDAARDLNLDVDSYEDLNYSNFLSILIRHYLQQRLGDTDIKLWSDSTDAYYPQPHLISKLDEENIEWMGSNDENVRGSGGKTGVWMYFFPEEEVDSLVRKIRLDIAERSKCPQEFRDALSEFPKIMNEHADLRTTGWDRYHATLNHELTHNYFHRNSNLSHFQKSNIPKMDFFGDINEAASQFVGKYIYRKRKTNEKSALDFTSSPERYGHYSNPEEIHYFVEIIREHTRHTRNNQAKLNVIDHVRNNVLRFIQDGTEKEDFLKRLTPEEFKIPIQRLERADGAISTKIQNIQEGLDAIERNIRNEPETMQKEFAQVRQDFEEIKTPEQIKKEIMNQAYQKMIEERKSYNFIGRFIEEELKEEIREFLDAHRHISKMNNVLDIEGNRRISDLIESLDELDEEVKSAEEAFKSILKDLERRTQIET
mgnify:CR=1 FL=1